MTIASCGPKTLPQVPGERNTAAAATARATEARMHETQAQTGDSAAGILSDEERQYFTRLYPDASRTIAMHTTYTRSGLAKAGAVGSLIDTKS